MPKLDNWKLVEYPYQEYTAPELRRKFLAGNVYGHKHLNEGVPCFTSTIVSLDIPNKTAKTKNTDYELGEIDPVYKKWCEDNKFIESEDK